MLHDEARELLVRGYEAAHDAVGIAKAYSVSKWTVYRLAEQKRETGSVALRTSRRGWKPILTAENKEHIRQCIDEKPDITIEEIREELNLSASYSTVERAVNAMGYTLKKKSLYASERDRIRCAGEAQSKETLLPTLKHGDIIVMDNMRSHHVKAVRDVLEEKGMKILYLPPYSPDLNPIEKMWSKMKALLRGWKIRNLDLLPDAVRLALASVSPLDCLHWFAASACC